MKAGRKTLWLLTLLVALPVAGAHGQAGYIGLFADPGGTQCSVSDPGVGEVNVYVIHQGTLGAAASQWRVVSGGGFAMAYAGETWAYPVVGDTRGGASVSYGSCLGAPNLLCTITFLTLGASPPCSYLEVVPDPASAGGTIEVVDCASSRLSAPGGRLYVNPNESCPCGQANAVTATDWGRIKAMFGE
jgi:hypothetical protein